MQSWKKHAVALAALTTALQGVFQASPDGFVRQLIILTTTTNVLSLLYAIYIFRLYERGTQGLRSVLTTRAMAIVDRSWLDMTPVRRQQLERNIEASVALLMVSIDKVAGMDEEAFGHAVGRMLGGRLDIRPEDIRAKVRLVGGE